MAKNDGFWAKSDLGHNLFGKNRGAQALRTLYPSHKVRQGGII